MLVKLSDEVLINPDYVVSVTAYPLMGWCIIKSTAGETTVYVDDGSSIDLLFDKIDALLNGEGWDNG